MSTTQRNRENGIEIYARFLKEITLNADIKKTNLMYKCNTKHHATSTNDLTIDRLLTIGKERGHITGFRTFRITKEGLDYLIMVHKLELKIKIEEDQK